MPLPQKRLIPGLLLALVIAAFAAPPLWWSAGDPPVIAPGAPENNKGPANIGQAKHMAKSALDALRPVLPAVADQIEADLVGVGKPIPSWAAPATQTERDKNHAPLLIGQLKAIADPFYTRLHATAPTWLEAVRTANGTHHPGSIFPWTSAVSDDNNKGIANIGQLKAVFSLRFETIATFDSDGDGTPDLWEIENGFDPNDPADAYSDPDGDGISNQQEEDLGTDPNSLDPIGPRNFGFAEEITYSPDLSFRPENPSDLYDEDSIEGWNAAIGQHIEIWKEDGGDTYAELQSHWDAKGIEQEFDMLPGTRLTFILRYKGRYDGYSYSNPFKLKVGGAYEVLVNGQPAQTHGSVKQQSFMADDTWEKYAVWHYASVSITADPQATKLVPITLTLSPEDTDGAITYGGFVDLLPVEVVSTDKFLAGSFEIPEGWNSLEMEFVGPGGENLGKYGTLLGGGTTKIYDKVEDILSESDVASGGQQDSQKVWFVKDSENDRKINFYTCFNSLGQAEVKLYVNGSSTANVSITHQLKAEQEFSDIIDYVDDWVKGESFYFPGTTPPTPGLLAAPMTMQSQSFFGEEEISHLTRAALIPFFNVINNVEGLSSVAVGLFDGVRNGLEDDWEFIRLIGTGAVDVGGFAYEQALAELQKWRDDPLKRASELKQLADKVCEVWVFEPMRELGEDLTSWEGFKRRSWQTIHFVYQRNQKNWTITKNVWGSIVDGLTDWADDFYGRMATGSEKAHWQSAPWVTDHILAEINSQTRQMCYTFGYTFGYLAEQVAVGALSAGTVKVAQVFAKGGVSLAGKLTTRTAGALSGQAHNLKALLAQTRDEFFDDLVNASRRNLAPAGSGPTGQGLPKPPLAVMQEGAAAGKFKWASYWGDIYSKPTLRKFTRTTAGSAILEKQMSRLMTIFGDEFTEALGRNFLKVADELIVVKQVDEAGKETLDEFFEAFFKGFEGNPSLMKNADEVAVRTGGSFETMSDQAKLFLKDFLTDPNAGDLWKLDDIPHIPNWQNTVPHKFWARGNLFEVLYYKKIYKGRGHTHHSNAPGFDTRKLGPEPEWTQIKSAANPNSAHQIERMKKAIDDLAVAAGDTSDPLILHILTRDDAVAATINAVKSHAPQFEERLTIIWEKYAHSQ